EWLNICALTKPRDWTDLENAVMKRATRNQLTRSLIVAGLLLLLSAAGVIVRAQIRKNSDAQHADGLVKQLLVAETAHVPTILPAIGKFRHLVDPALRAHFLAASPSSRQKLNASLALLPVDRGQIEFLLAELLDAAPQDLLVIRAALEPYR